MDTATALPLISAILVFVLGLFVWRKGPREKVNFTFGLFAFVITIWMFGTFMMFLNKSNTGAVIFWDKFVYLGVVFIPVIMFHFGLALTHRKIIRSRLLLILGYIFSLFFVCLIPTDLFVNGAFIYQWGAHTKAQIFHHIFLAYFALYLILWFVVVYKYFRYNISSIEKERIKYCFIAFLILAIFGSLGYLPAYGIGIYPFAYLSGLAFVLIMSYAIVVHRLMDIKIALRRSFIYITSVLVIIIPSSVILYYFDLYFPNYIILASLGILIFAVSFFSPIRNYYYRIANKYFFSSLYDSREVIGKLSEGLRSTLDAKQIYSLISETLMDALHIKSFGVLKYLERGRQNSRYAIQYNNGFDLGGAKEFEGDRGLHQDYIEKTKPFVVEEIKNTSYQEHKAVIDLLTRLGVAVVVPLNVKDETLGIMALGAKESGDMFNDEDLKTLETISSQAAIAIKNAQLYEETKKFSITLQKEVERQTAELKRANEELQKLDKAKSDFISIASHQLRTPLTAIKGFTSMILEGSYGKVSVTLKDKMEKIYESTERLIKLVNELLDLTHIESGKIEYNLAKVDFDQMVQSVAEELKGQAEKKKLALSVDLANKELWVNADESKLRQVVMNLIDNAVKYTEKGNIKVSVCQKDGFVEFCVKDTGIGLSAEGIKTLFQKFVRGETASHYHTEGSGVGLYVAKKLIEDQKGQIWVESEGENRGSSFFIKMPAYQSNVEEGQARQ